MAKSKKEELKITLKKSTIGCLKKQILTVKALGLSKIGQSKVFVKNDCLQGMIKVVSHLISVEEI